MHPTFQLILNSICPPTTPPTPQGKFEHVLETELGELVCWFDPHEADPAYGAGESLVLTNAWLKHVDVVGVLEGWVVIRVQNAALRALQLDREEARVEHLVGRAA